MALASEILARAFEKATSSLPDLQNDDLIERFGKLNDDLGLLDLLRRLNAADSELSDRMKDKNVILIFGADESLDIRSFRNAPAAMEALFALERDNPERDVV